MATDSLLLVNATDDDLLGTNAALYTSAAFAVAGFVHGVTGFGAGMTAMAIAPLGMQLMDAVAIVAIYVLVVCLALSFMLRESLSNPAVRSMLPPLCAGSVLGVPLGVKLLTQTDPRLLKILLGASMVAFVVERILHECKHAQDPSREASPRSSKTNSPEALWGADSNESPARRSPPGVAATVARKAACRGEGGDGTATAGGAESAERRLLPSGTLLSSMATDVGGGGYLAPPSLSLWGPAGPLALSPSPALASAAASYVGSAVDGASEATGGAISKGYAPFASPRLSPSSRSRLERVSYWGEELSDAEPPNHCKGCWQRGREMTAGFAIGAASGLLDGALNEGGPPVIIFVTLQGWPKDDAKATLQFFFLVAQVFTVLTLASQGVLETRHLVYDLLGLPAAALGLALGVCVYEKLDQQVFTRLVVVAMAITGSSYIISSAIDLHANPSRPL